MPFQEEIIDATNQPLGRVATKAAALLRGKGTPLFDPAQLPNVKVTIQHAGQLRFTGNKLDQKNYYHFSGYPGGLKTTKLRDLFARSPETVIRHAVRRMLPANKLRPRLLKRLTVTV